MAEQFDQLAPVALPASGAPNARLRKHADYQRVYQASRKHFSASMSYFYAARPVGVDGAAPGAATAGAGPVRPGSPAASSGHSNAAAQGPRVGLTAGRVLGKAVDRNRIKRRMRETVRKNIAKLTADVDVVLHPRKSVLSIEYLKLEAEVAHIFAAVQAALDRHRSGKP